MNRKVSISLIILAICLIGFVSSSRAQKPYRAGTTTANFLEICYGSAGVAMGDAQVGATQDLSSA